MGKIQSTSEESVVAFTLLSTVPRLEMSDLKYKHVRRIRREQLIKDLDNSDPETVANALYAANKI